MKRLVLLAFLAAAALAPGAGAAAAPPRVLVIHFEADVNPVTQEYRDLWILRFAPDGRVEDFEEWAFWPDKPYTAGQVIES